MEHRRIAKEVKYLSTNGVTLNQEEKMNLSLSLAKLQCECPFEELMLWGKIEGKSPIPYLS